MRALSHVPQTMEESLVVLFAGMIKALLQREYIQANDKYLQIAIGNAPWPIGPCVTIAQSVQCGPDFAQV